MNAGQEMFFVQQFYSSQGFLHNGIIAGQARGVMIETLKDEINKC